MKRRPEPTNVYDLAAYRSLLQHAPQDVALEVRKVVSRLSCRWTPQKLAWQARKVRVGDAAGGAR